MAVFVMLAAGHVHKLQLLSTSLFRLFDATRTHSSLIGTFLFFALSMYHSLCLQMRIYTPKNELCSSIAANYGPNGLHPPPSFPISDCPAAADARAIPVIISMVLPAIARRF